VVFCGTIKEKTKKNRLKTTTYKIITKKVKKSIYNHFAIGHQLIIETANRLKRQQKLSIV